MDEVDIATVAAVPIALLLLAGLVWVTRSGWYWLFMAFYVNPVILKPIVIAILLLAVVWIIGKKKVAKEEITPQTYQKWIKNCAIVVSVLVIIGWFVLGSFQVMYP